MKRFSAAVNVGTAFGTGNVADAGAGLVMALVLVLITGTLSM
jgi:hypothetical protein